MKNLLIEIILKMKIYKIHYNILSDLNGIYHYTPSKITVVANTKKEALEKFKKDVILEPQVIEIREKSI